MKANQDLRNYAKENSISFWRVAKKLNRSESFVCRLLREELEPEMSEKLRKIIRELIEEQEYCQ